MPGADRPALRLRAPSPLAGSLRPGYHPHGQLRPDQAGPACASEGGDIANRSLTPFELDQARRVFGDTIDWQRVRLTESAAWARRLAAFGARLRRNPPPADNAVTLWHHIYFSRALTLHAQAATRASDMGWLMHELTHVWQYERRGLRVLLAAIRLHLRPGKDPYAYGGKAALLGSASLPDLQSFNLEQQADLVRDYYLSLLGGEDTQAWEPYVGQLRRV